jgi:hypothetical protein
MKYNLLLLIMTLLLSCQGSNDTPNKPAKINTETHEIDLVKNWLTNSLNEYFKKDVSMRSITSDLYFERKSDAMKVGSSGGLTIQGFKAKYGVRHPVEFAGLGKGFLLPNENYGQIEIGKCVFKNRTEMKGFLFEVSLKDLSIQKEFIREIVVTKSWNAFEIDNVLEHE